MGTSRRSGKSPGKGNLSMQQKNRQGTSAEKKLMLKKIPAVIAKLPET